MDPVSWSRLETFLLSERDLAPSTTHKTLRFLRALERAGLDLEKPGRDAYNAFLARRKREGKDGPGLRHYGRAVRHLLAFRGQSWPDLRLPRARASLRPLINESVLAHLLEYDRGRDELETTAARFAFRFGFYSAVRAPSEVVAIELDDFDQVAGTLRVWSDKTGTHRTLQLEPWLAHLVRDYITVHRDEVRHGQPRSLILDPHDGRPFRSPAAYRMWLKRAAAAVSPTFYPYQLRVAGATWRAIQWDLNVYLLKEWLGHAKISSTEYYLRIARSIVERRQAAADVRPYELGALV